VRRSELLRVVRRDAQASRGMAAGGAKGYGSDFILRPASKESQGAQARSSREVREQSQESPELADFARGLHSPPVRSMQPVAPHTGDRGL
jgi:hypothetical protein